MDARSSAVLRVTHRLDRQGGDHVGSLDLEDDLARLAGPDRFHARRIDRLDAAGRSGQSWPVASAVSSGRPVAQAVAADAIARIDRLGVLPRLLVGHVVGRIGPEVWPLVVLRDRVGAVGVEAVVVAGIDLVLAQVEDVAMAQVPVVEVVAVLQPAGIEAAVLVGQRSDGVAAGSGSRWGWWRPGSGTWRCGPARSCRRWPRTRPRPRCPPRRRWSCRRRACRSPTASCRTCASGRRSSPPARCAG